MYGGVVDGRGTPRSTHPTFPRSQAVGTRTPTQVRTHAQKLFLRQQKETQGSMQPAKGGTRDMPDMPQLTMPDGDLGQGTMGSLQEAAYLAQLQETDDGSDMKEPF